MNGIVNVYKEAGMTSFDVVAKVRRIFNVSKCGHLGTLDPMAEGVLPVLIGYATRFADYLSSADKEYIAEFKLGERSQSYDNTSEIEKVSDKIINENDIKNILNSLTGKISLKVPAYSAKKINGIRAYKLARKGVIEDAGEKEMEIYSINLLNYEYPLGIIKVSCGKGTYIRSIINTLGERLETGALMSGLIRSANGVFKSNKSYKIYQLEKLSEKNELLQAVIPVYNILDWGKAVVKDSFIKYIKNGVSPDRDSFLSFPIEHEGSNFFIMDNNGNLLAAAERCESSDHPLKLSIVIN
ncbi:MAG: tRNA pseudouridine(55) synthase TruB [Mucispirillum sp.]|nr:tRNA pseudouridine(55) synthase TruB [Mucispirillum sp.]